MSQSDPRMSGSAIVLQANFVNFGAAETVYLAAPEAGFIKEIHVARYAAGGTNFSTLTLNTPSGAVSPTMALATGGAAGDIDSQEFSKNDTNNVLAAGDGFSIVSDGLADGTPGGVVIVVLEVY